MATIAQASYVGSLGREAELEESTDEPDENSGPAFLRRTVERWLDFSDLEDGWEATPTYETDPNARPDEFFTSMVEGTLDPKVTPPIQIRRIRADQATGPEAVMIAALRRKEAEKHERDTVARDVEPTAGDGPVPPASS